MSKIGQLKTGQPIEKAMREIRDWLSKIDVNGLYINTNYDPKQNIAILQFTYKGKNYEFRSTKQRNSRLNMHAISKVMEYKIRAQLMGIEDFEKSMKAYLQLEDHTGIKKEQGEEATSYDYSLLGMNKTDSNEELTVRYKKLMKAFHPDMSLSDEAKSEFEKKTAEINESWAKIKKERMM